eukprot:gene21636-28645_t
MSTDANSAAMANNEQPENSYTLPMGSSRELPMPSVFAGSGYEQEEQAGAATAINAQQLPSAPASISYGQQELSATASIGYGQQELSATASIGNGQQELSASASIGEGQQESSAPASISDGQQEPSATSSIGNGQQELSATASIGSSELEISARDSASNAQGSKNARMSGFQHPGRASMRLRRSKWNALDQASRTEVTELFEELSHFDERKQAKAKEANLTFSVVNLVDLLKAYRRRVQISKAISTTSSTKLASLSSNALRRHSSMVPERTATLASDPEDPLPSSPLKSMLQKSRSVTITMPAQSPKAKSSVSRSQCLSRTHSSGLDSVKEEGSPGGSSGSFDHSQASSAPVGCSVTPPGLVMRRSALRVLSTLEAVEAALAAVDGGGSDDVGANCAGGVGPKSSEASRLSHALSKPLDSRRLCPRSTVGQDAAAAAVAAADAEKGEGGDVGASCAGRVCPKSSEASRLSHALSKPLDSRRSCPRSTVGQDAAAAAVAAADAEKGEGGDVGASCAGRVCPKSSEANRLSHALSKPLDSRRSCPRSTVGQDAAAAAVAAVDAGVRGSDAMHAPAGLLPSGCEASIGEDARGGVSNSVVRSGLLPASLAQDAGQQDASMGQVEVSIEDLAALFDASLEQGSGSRKPSREKSALVEEASRQASAVQAVQADASLLSKSVSFHMKNDCDAESPSNSGVRQSEAVHGGSTNSDFSQKTEGLNSTINWSLTRTSSHFDEKEDVIPVRPMYSDSDSYFSPREDDGSSSDGQRFGSAAFPSSPSPLLPPLQPATAGGTESMGADWAPEPEFQGGEDLGFEPRVELTSSSDPEAVGGLEWSGPARGEGMGSLSASSVGGLGGVSEGSGGQYSKGVPEGNGGQYSPNSGQNNPNEDSHSPKGESKPQQGSGQQGLKNAAQDSYEEGYELLLYPVVGSHHRLARLPNMDVPVLTNTLSVLLNMENQKERGRGARGAGARVLADRMWEGFTQSWLRAPRGGGGAGAQGAEENSKEKNRGKVKSCPQYQDPVQTQGSHQAYGNYKSRGRGPRVSLPPDIQEGGGPAAGGAEANRGGNTQRASITLRGPLEKGKDNSATAPRWQPSYANALKPLLGRAPPQGPPRLPLGGQGDGNSDGNRARLVVENSSVSKVNSWVAPPGSHKTSSTQPGVRGNTKLPELNHKDAGPQGGRQQDMGPRHTKQASYMMPILSQMDLQPPTLGRNLGLQRMDAALHHAHGDEKRASTSSLGGGVDAPGQRLSRLHPLLRGPMVVTTRSVSDQAVPTKHHQEVLGKASSHRASKAVMSASRPTWHQRRGQPGNVI